MVEVAIDTASDMAGLALTREGELIAELTWRTKQNHSKDLLPALDLLLRRGGLARAEIEALFVCLGPGSYAGLRVGLSTAKTLAYALDAKLAGVGRLAADALPFVGAHTGRTVAVHAAGRAELAWAVYEAMPEGIGERLAPRLSPRDGFLAGLRKGDVVIGELDEALRADIASAGALWVEPVAARVAAVARLGWQRLAAGNIDSADGLVPLYLREPAIGKPHPPAPSP